MFYITYRYSSCPCNGCCTDNGVAVIVCKSKTLNGAIDFIQSYTELDSRNAIDIIYYPDGNKGAGGILSVKDLYFYSKDNLILSIASDEFQRGGEMLHRLKSFYHVQCRNMGITPSIYYNIKIKLCSSF